MAKQSRRPPSSHPGKSEGLPRNAGANNTADGRAVLPTDAPPAALRSSYVEAVGLYEQAMHQLQLKKFADAAELLQRVLTAYPEERELLERVRLYLSMCERQTRQADSEPQSIEDLLFAATLALNAGDVGRALGYLDRVQQAQPDNDQALYMRAVAHTERGEPDLAIACLQRAIQVNAENRALARLDPDLEPLRAVDGVADLLEGGHSPDGHRSQAARRRSL